jgi:hypothetical protein
MPDTFVEMTFDAWVQIYKPIINHIDTNSSFDGLMFETYGDEVEFVKSKSPANIWTYGDGDDSGTYIWNGYHIVNRIGYFITEVPCPPDTTIQIQVSIPCYYCENCDTEHDDIDNLIRDAFQDADLDKCPNCATVEELTLLGIGK